MPARNAAMRRSSSVLQSGVGWSQVEDTGSAGPVEHPNPVPLTDASRRLAADGGPATKHLWDVSAAPTRPPKAWASIKSIVNCPRLLTVGTAHSSVAKSAAKSTAHASTRCLGDPRSRT